MKRRVSTEVGAGEKRMEVSSGEGGAWEKGMGVLNKKRMRMGDGYGR